ncbi:MAG: ABC transporter ATP-binding protein [Acidobacteria bacterium]|nr:MAG: ABC transporter ATP-binding protein [Acidobacteriota bacterium]PYQ21914.1 MAG: ABC transporter ATP-binding protein [Acidobacteriota bacterium]
MSSEVVVEARELGKSYYIYATPQDVLLRQVYGQMASMPGLPRVLRVRAEERAARHGRRFDALRGVSFEVRRGEALGVIGRNGSGKSTLLQIVAGTLVPSHGSVDVSGRVGALLELGSGFNPEFTGRENVVLNGTILGASPLEMRAKMAEIVEFADIGEFLDQPVKTYSSGMLLRLAFAVQVSLAPEVLIVDEALSVGDVFFAQKCVRRIKELQARGTTLLFVSHDLALVRDLCERAIYLRQGSVRFQGPKDKAIALYYQSGSGEHPLRVPALADGFGSARDQELLREFKARACWASAEAPRPGQEARIAAVVAADLDGRPCLDARLGDELTLQVLYQSLGSTPVHFAVAIKNRYDQLIFSGGSYTQRLQPPVLEPGEFGVFEITLTCMIEAGAYTFRVTLGASREELNRGMKLDETPWLGPLTIRWDYEAEVAPFLGMFGLPAVTRFKPLRED